MGLRARFTMLLLAAALIGAAVVVRVWLAATGAYTQGSHAVPLRAGSAIALFGGFLLAAFAVAWPMGDARTRQHGPATPTREREREP